MSVIISLAKDHLSRFNKKGFYTLFQILIPVLASAALIYHFNTIDINWNYLKISLFFVIPFLIVFATINLIIETSIWKRIIGNSENLSDNALFRIICECYTIASFSSGLIGSILGKNKIFGLRRVKSNLSSNLIFGFYQTIASLMLSGIIWMISGAEFGIFTFYKYESIVYSLIILLSGLIILLIGTKLLSIKMDLAPFGLGLLRSLIYFLQFGIILSYFYELHFLSLSLGIVAIYFILKTLLPFINIFGGLGTREFTLGLLFSAFGLEPQAIVFGSLLIWISNFVFPNVLGMISLSKKGNWNSITYS